MDRSLADRLNDLWAQSEKLREAEETYLTLEANRKPLLAQLTLAAEGKSFTEREAKALASEDWRRFMGGHVHSEVALNHARRKWEMLEKAYLAEYASFKLDDRSLKGKVGA